MRGMLVLLLLVAAVSWAPLQTQAVGLAIPAVGGLLLLKALILVGVSKGIPFPLGKRSAEDPVQEGENLLLSTVSQLDQSGCILKMLCRLQTKQEGTRTQEEDLLVNMFVNGTESITSYNAAFVYAADIGSKTHNTAVCDKFFNKCPLSDGELSTLLRQAWGCGLQIQQEE